MRGRSRLLSDADFTRYVPTTKEPEPSPLAEFVNHLETSFKGIDGGGKGKISQEQWNRLMKEFGFGESDTTELFKRICGKKTFLNYRNFIRALRYVVKTNPTVVAGDLINMSVNIILRKRRSSQCEKEMKASIETIDENAELPALEDKMETEPLSEVLGNPEEFLMEVPVELDGLEGIGHLGHSANLAHVNAIQEGVIEELREWIHETGMPAVERLKEAEAKMAEMVDKFESERERLTKQRCQAEEIAKNYRTKQQEFYDQFSYKLVRKEDKHRDALDEMASKAEGAAQAEKALQGELREVRHRLGHLINENKELTTSNELLQNKGTSVTISHDMLMRENRTQKKAIAQLRKDLAEATARIQGLQREISRLELKQLEDAPQTREALISNGRRASKALLEVMAASFPGEVESELQEEHEDVPRSRSRSRSASVSRLERVDAPSPSNRSNSGPPDGAFFQMDDRHELPSEGGNERLEGAVDAMREEMGRNHGELRASQEEMARSLAALQRRLESLLGPGGERRKGGGAEEEWHLSKEGDFVQGSHGNGFRAHALGANSNEVREYKS